MQQSNTVVTRMPPLERITLLWAEWFNRLAMAGLLAILIISVSDVIGGRAFNKPVPGSLDIGLCSCCW